MKEFNELCKFVEKIDPVTYTELVTNYSLSILPELAKITGSEDLAVEQFSMFILGAIASDGKLALGEYLVCEPLIKTFFGDTIDYEQAKNRIEKMKDEMDELKNTVDKMVDTYGKLSAKLKEDIIVVCLLLCSIDGKISSKEKKWIKQLIA